MSYALPVSVRLARDASRASLRHSDRETKGRRGQHGKPQQDCCLARRHGRSGAARVARRRWGRSQPTVLARTAADADALRLGLGVGAVFELQPASRRLFDGRGRASLRDALPVRPAEGQVHPVARHERRLVRQHVRRHPSERREVERRQAADRRRRQVHLRDREARRVPVLDHVGDGAPADRGRGQHGSVPPSGASRTTRSGT